MAFFVIQALTGLAQASSLFLVASGLSIIFGVTRIVNFAHGAFAMLGAYMAWTLTQQLTGPVGFWAALPLAAAIVAGLGALLEMTLLRRLYRAPDLFQLLATFGVTLMVEDLAILIWGPDDLLGPRAPGLKGAVMVMGHALPSYDVFLIVAGPVVFGLLWLLFRRTRFGTLVRAATQDREMVAALGVDQRWLFTAVFALGVFLAALGGALQIPRDAVNHTMDLRLIVEAFVIVVIGGLGSVGGAFLASVLVAELNAFGIVVLPAVSLVLTFAIMAAVLVVRPNGLLGRAPTAARPIAPTLRPWAPMTRTGQLATVAMVVAAAALPLVAGPYGLAVAAEIAIAVIVAISLQLLISVGGLVSFGHAAAFGLGVYGAALAVHAAGLPLLPALGCAVGLALAGAALFGAVCVRLTGIPFAMLTLAVAQILWSIAFQWTDVTGGDNGLLGIWPDAWASSPRAFYWLCLAAAALGVLAVRTVVFAPFGYALRAVRDAPGRAEASGLGRQRLQWVALVLAGGLAGLAGGLYAFLKGSVFPDSFAVATSVDALAMVLLGGVGTLTGGVWGAIAYKALSIGLVSRTDYSKLALGALIVALTVAAPGGIGGAWQALRERLGGAARRNA